MAIDKDKKTESSEGQAERTLRFKGRQWIVGANVLVMVVLATALLVFANYLAFTFNKKSDWTSVGINSLGDQTQSLLKGLDEDVKLTSLYQTFQEPEVEEEAKKFRTAVEDILSLYQIESPSKVEVTFINPIKDRDKTLALVQSLRKKEAYQGEAKRHKAIIDTFVKKQFKAILGLLQSEHEKLKGFSDVDSALKDVRDYVIVMQNCSVLSKMVTRTKEDVSILVGDDLPKYTNAVNAIKSFYERTQAALSGAGEWMAQVEKWSKANKVKPPQDKTFFTQAPERYKKLLDDIQAELDKTKDLPSLKLEDLDRQVQPNTVIVESKDEARVLSFEKVWPSKEKGRLGQPVGNLFKNRRCAAEVEISSALLQLTQRTKTAVVFVRYGGRPLFFGGMMMGGPQALYGGAKDRLEKANFIVKEWDVGTKKQPPEFEEGEKPDRIIWVLLKPDQIPPPRGMPPQMRRPQQQFGPAERQAIESAMGNDPRVLVVAGWIPPPRQQMMMMAPPPVYQYNDWLKEQWGLEVQFRYPVLEWKEREPGKMGPTRRGPVTITRHQLSDHPIVETLRGIQGVFPETAPIKKLDKLPDGVQIADLATIPYGDDIWAESDLNDLNEQFQSNQGARKGKMDISGPFPIAVAATRKREDTSAGKLVLVSSMSFAIDGVALAGRMLLTGNGVMTIPTNPANMSMLINAIHWLNDNEGLIGQGIEDRDIPRLTKLEPGPGQTAAQTLAVGIWPALALLGGLVVWFVRRR